MSPDHNFADSLVRLNFRHLMTEMANLKLRAVLRHAAGKGWPNGVAVDGMKSYSDVG